MQVLNAVHVALHAGRGASKGMLAGRLKVPRRARHASSYSRASGTHHLAAQGLQVAPPRPLKQKVPAVQSG